MRQGPGVFNRKIGNIFHSRTSRLQTSKSNRHDFSAFTRRMILNFSQKKVQNQIAHRNPRHSFLRENQLPVGTTLRNPIPYQILGKNRTTFRNVQSATAWKIPLRSPDEKGAPESAARRIRIISAHHRSSALAATKASVTWLTDRPRRAHCTERERETARALVLGARAKSHT